MSSRRSAIAFAQPQARSRVGNGSALLEGIDGRTTGARRYKELLAQLGIEIIGQGNGRLTEAQIILARRAVLLTMWCESAEAKMANGDDIDISEFTAAANALRRIMADAGLIGPAIQRF